MAANSTWYTLTAIFVAFVGVTGLGLLFVRATNIDRNGLVGALTVLTAIIAAAIMYFSGSTRMSEWALVVVALFSVTGFVFGRALDRWLGAKDLSVDARKGTLGSDLSD
ncbi:MAG: hypothetical protein ACAH95_04715 [Fimbriimonas sp.]